MHTDDSKMDKMVDSALKPWRDAVRAATLHACEGLVARATKVDSAAMVVIMCKEDLPAMNADEVSAYVEEFVPPHSVVLWQKTAECECETHDHWHVPVVHEEFAEYLREQGLL